MSDLTRLFMGKDAYIKETTKKNDVVAIAIDQLRPTQFTVGEWEVKWHLKELQALIPRGSELVHTHLQKELGRAVAGPDGSFYLVDGHHFACALLIAGIPEMYVVIAKNWKDVKASKLTDKLKDEGFFYRWDQAGNKRKFSELPDHVSRLSNDPYRSLAWLAHMIGAYEKKNEPYQEFEWAEYFRDEIQLPENPKADDLKSAAALLVDVCRKKKAKKLEGYVKLRDSSEELLVSKLKTTLKELGV